MSVYKDEKMVPGDVFTVIPIGRARGSRRRKEDSAPKERLRPGNGKNC